jgi:hypothetical protein
MSLNKNIDTSKPLKETSLDYNPVYKVNYIKNGSIDTIYLFYGAKIESNKEDEIIKTIFTEEEYSKLKSDNTKIIFSEHQIHYDDSIGTIKIKIHVG